MAAKTSPREITYHSLDDIAPAERNSKDHEEELIGQSIARFGFIEAMIMDERTGRLVGGHGRLAELRRREATGQEPPEGIAVVDGTWRAPVQRGWRSRSDEEALAAGIALNRVGERGGWHYADLHEDLTLLATTVDDGLLGLGFDASDLDALAVTGSDEQLFNPRENADEGLDDLQKFLNQTRLVLVLDPETYARFKAVEGADDEDRLLRLLSGA